MRRVTLLASGAILAGLALVGCGSKETAGTPSGQQGGEQQGQTLQLLAERIGAKSAKQSAHLTMTMDAAGVSIKAEGDMRFGDPLAMDLQYELPGLGKARMLLVDDAFYFQLPKEMGAVKPWVKLDANGEDPLSKSLGAALRETKKNSDPSQLLSQIKDAGEITATKQEDLNGKPTTHYSVTVDIKKYADKLDPELKSAMDEVTKAGVDKFPLEVWVDKDNLPVRITVKTPFTNPQTQKAENVAMTLDYSDWGKAVDVTAPPPDQVGELPGR